MSVLIPGMEMPTSPVLFCIHPDGKVFADLEGGWREYKAVPVPEHGRLIDADALFKKAHYRMGITPGGIDEVEAFIRAIDLLKAPTIIPAEEGET